MEKPVILAIDTSTRRGSVFLQLPGSDGRFQALDAGAVQGRQLAPAIQEVLAAEGLAPQEVGLLAVGLGPGSYTGLRVGIALAASMAYALPCDRVGVSSFAALAQAVGQEGEELLCLGPQGQDTYAQALFRVVQARAVEIAPHAIASGEELRALTRPGRRLVGEGAEAFPGGEADQLPDARAVAERGWVEYQEQGATPADRFLPLYLRRSTAELNWERQNKDRAP